MTTKDKIKYIDLMKKVFAGGVGALLFLIMLQFIVDAAIMYDDDKVNCERTEKWCVRYVGVEGILSNIEEKRVSCDSDYDFYMWYSENQINCKIDLNKYYD